MGIKLKDAVVIFDEVSGPTVSRSLWITMFSCYFTRLYTSLVKNVGGDVTISRNMFSLAVYTLILRRTTWKT